MPRPYVKGRQQDIPGTYEYERHRVTQNEQTEKNIWGRAVNPKIKELRAQMWDRFPGIKQYRMPREVADRTDIGMEAKIVYSFLSNFNAGVRLTRSEIAGMCALSLYQTAKGVYDLKAANLLEERVRNIKNDQGGIIKLPSYYRVFTPPKRHMYKRAPLWTKSDLSDLEEIVNEYFYET